MPHLSPAIRSGNLLFLSGQLAFGPEGDIAQQTRCVLDRLFETLAASGLKPSDVVKANVWLVDRADFPTFDAAYAAAFGEHRPTRSTVISALAIEAAKVEIDLVASFGPAQPA
jgi:enamine deaminase RidA (YjgF/YER057c/UK114 family)